MISSLCRSTAFATIWLRAAVRRPNPMAAALCRTARRSLGSLHPGPKLQAAEPHPGGGIQFRGLTTSQSRRSDGSHQGLPERDPIHPSLFYHQVSSGSPVFALSFINRPLNPGYPGSRTILGWVGDGGNALGEDVGSGFQENPGFRELLHEAIQSALNAPDLDKTIEAEAIQRGEGWLHINDLRNIPALGRIGDPDDIIGTVMVRDGKVIPETYQAMPSYRLCTADGPTRLPDGLAQKLRELLEEESAAEKIGS